MIGAIDCTHIRIICPNKENAMAFVKRKQFYPTNVQAVCDRDAFITNIVACRCVIESCFRLLKRSFARLRFGLRTVLANTLVTVATALLPNFALQYLSRADDIVVAADASGNVTNVRQLIVSRYFT